MERIAKIVGARADGRRRARTFEEKPPRAAARVETPSAACADDIALARELWSGTCGSGWRGPRGARFFEALRKPTPGRLRCARSGPSDSART